jgi:polysaccharide pyruvyl transferase WcaK-like protein
VGRNVIARYLSGTSVQSPAYLPSLKDFSLNERTPMVLNSVGLGNMLPEGSTEGSDLAIEVIRSAAFVGVRDAASQSFASTIGKPAELSPDMVHAISVRHPEIATPTKASDPYFIFQSNAHLILEFGAETIARALARVAAVTHWRPAFFLAGTARHHDRSDQYDGIRLALKVIDPTIVPKTFTTRDPMDLASYIAGSQLWIGSSLHGRIIAGSFSLPRVSLENLKVATYASTWDAVFPADVGFDRLQDSVAEAITAAHLPSNISASREVADLADRATKSLMRRFQ